MKINFLITYDVKDNHEQIIADLLENGWHSVVPASAIGTKKPFCATCQKQPGTSRLDQVLKLQRNLNVLPARAIF